MLKSVFAAGIGVLWCGISFAAHPLITDDTGTQGKGKFQIEVNGDIAYDKERAFDEDTAGYATEETTGRELATILSFGIMDTLDIVVGIPYQWSKVKNNGTAEPDVDGISDVSLEAKWRFYEKEGLSFALKPGATLPTGDENKGLGNGRASYGLTFVTTKEMAPFAFHLNLGYTHNEYKLQDDKGANRKGIWHVSLASEAEVVKDLRVVANIGVERNSDKSSTTHPAFILGGIIYSITENFDVDFGVKAGLNRTETDSALLAGMAIRF